MFTYLISYLAALVAIHFMNSKETQTRYKMPVHWALFAALFGWLTVTVVLLATYETQIKAWYKDTIVPTFGKFNALFKG